jgi:hypothetical protein
LLDLATLREAELIAEQSALANGGAHHNGNGGVIHL